MPLIDAYIKCGKIQGGYKATVRNTTAKLEEAHDGWSEIYSFGYSLSKEYPTLTISKPTDVSSNDLYLLYLQSHSRDMQKAMKARDHLIDEIKIDLCRWVDTNNDGVVDEFQVYLEYTFNQCRVRSYGTSINFSAEDYPEESIDFGFRRMTMKYWRPEDPTQFTWDFMKALDK